MVKYLTKRLINEITFRTSTKTFRVMAGNHQQLLFIKMMIMKKKKKKKKKEKRMMMLKVKTINKK